MFACEKADVCCTMLPHVVLCAVIQRLATAHVFMPSLRPNDFYFQKDGVFGGYEKSERKRNDENHDIVYCFAASGAWR